MPCSVGRGTPKFPTSKLTLQDITENGNTTTLSIKSNAYFLGDGSLLEGVAKDADLSSNAARISNLENNTIISNSSGITSGFTQGDIIYASSDNTLEKLNIGNNNQFLKVSSGLPEWSNIVLQNVTDDGSNLTLTGNIEALAFYGDGSNLTGIPNEERLTNIEENVIVSNSSGITTGFTRGDLIYASADNTLNKLSLGTNGKVLKSDGTDVYWGNVASGAANVGTFQQVADTGNTTTNTIQFNNTTTSLTTAGDVFIGGTLSFPDQGNGGVIDLTAPGYTFGTAVLTLVPDGKFIVSENGYLESSGDIEYVAATNNIVTTGNIEALSFFGDGSNLTGVALSSDMTSNASRIENLETATIISNSSGITSGFARGDLIYASADNTLNKLSLGTNGKVLKSDGTDVYWGDDITAGDANVGTFQQVTDTGNTTTNTIQFNNTTTSLTTAGDVFIGGRLTLSDSAGGGLIDLTAPGYTYGTPLLTAIPDGKFIVSENGYLESSGDIEYVAATNNIVTTGNIEALSFFGDGSNLTGVALSSDMTSNSSRITGIENNLVDNSTRITNLENSSVSDDRITGIESNLVDNSSRITTLENSSVSDARITGIESNLVDNSSRITNLENNVIISNSSGITTGFTRGDLIYASSDNTLSKLSLGADGKVLKSDGTDVYWGDDITAGDADVETLQQVTDAGNTTSNTIQFTNATTGIVATGNIEALAFYGDGTTLTGVALSSDLTDNSSRISDLEPIKSNTSTLFVSGNNTGISNTNPEHTLAIGSNIHFDDTGTDKFFIQGDIQNAGIIKTFRLITTTLFIKNQIVVTERPKNTQNI